MTRDARSTVEVADEVIRILCTLGTAREGSSPARLAAAEAGLAAASAELAARIPVGRAVIRDGFAFVAAAGDGTPVITCHPIHQDLDQVAMAESQRRHEEEVLRLASMCSAGRLDGLRQAERIFLAGEAILALTGPAELSEGYRALALMDGRDAPRDMGQFYGLARELIARVRAQSPPRLQAADLERLVFPGWDDDEPSGPIGPDYSALDLTSEECERID